MVLTLFLQGKYISNFQYKIHIIFEMFLQFLHVTICILRVMESDVKIMQTKQSEIYNAAV